MPRQEWTSAIKGGGLDSIKNGAVVTQGTDAMRPMPPPIPGSGRGDEYGNVAIKKGTYADQGAGGGLGLLTGMLDPMSARDSGGNWRLPPALSAIPTLVGAAKDAVTGNFGKATKTVGDFSTGVGQGVIDTGKKIISGDSQARGEGLGEALMQVVLAKLMDAANTIKGGKTGPSAAAAPVEATVESVPAQLGPGGPRGLVGPKQPYASPESSVATAPKQLQSGGPSYSEPGPAIDVKSYPTERGPSGPARPMPPPSRQQLKAPDVKQLKAGSPAGELPKSPMETSTPDSSRVTGGVEPKKVLDRGGRANRGQMGYRATGETDPASLESRIAEGPNPPPSGSNWALNDTPKTIPVRGADGRFKAVPVGSLPADVVRKHFEAKSEIERHANKPVANKQPSPPKAPPVKEKK